MLSKRLKMCFFSNCLWTNIKKLTLYKVWKILFLVNILAYEGERLIVTI